MLLENQQRSTNTPKEIHKHNYTDYILDLTILLKLLEYFKTIFID